MQRMRFMFLAVTVALTACASVVNRATHQFTENLTTGILNEDDIDTVHDGVPAYLMLIDGIIEGDPENASTLLAGAKLYGAYAGGFVGDPVRAQRMADRAYNYARRALCVREKKLYDALQGPFDQFQTALNQADKRDIETLYGFAAAWAGRTQVNTGDWNAIADLPKLQSLLMEIAAIDPGYDNGGAYLYLGVINSIRPASLGGKPEEGKANFDKALELSQGKNQMVRVLYAQFYARLVFDKELHDKLLNEVLAADPVAPRLTLINTLAKVKAKALLESGKDYF
ncbi:MAG TPA: TRAP transporter TatT component family protein [Rudaea sp.]|jgi:tetratricopeptide (TPR) repeat protein|nr:TRAP transporter TatT component family protein [Rudaea sp.]